MGEPLVINSWRSVEDLVLRPPRAAYTREELLGGADGEFDVPGGPDGAPVRCFRMDVELENPRKERLLGSHYFLVDQWKATVQLPCVVYAHGNAGCRVDANVVAHALLKRGLSCFCFDFSGSGQSDGDVVTLGARESVDLDTVVGFLRIQGRTSNIALWGRSMGAVTAALYAKRNLSIAGCVLDSPFARLTDLIRDIVVRDIAADVNVPGLLVSGAILALRTSIRRRTGVDISSVNALDAAPSCYQPCLLIHAREDELIYPCHSEALRDAWAGDARLLLLGEGQGHNSQRPRHIVNSAVLFLSRVLGGGLKDAESLYRDVGDGSRPPIPPPRPRDANDARAAALQQLWLSMANEAEEIAKRSGDAADGDDEESESSFDESSEPSPSPQPPDRRRAAPLTPDGGDTVVRRLEDMHLVS